MIKIIVSCLVVLFLCSCASVNGPCDRKKTAKSGSCHTVPGKSKNCPRAKIQSNRSGQKPVQKKAVVKKRQSVSGTFAGDKNVSDDF